MEASKLKRKTIYSPVGALDATVPLETHPTVAKLKYLDETTTDEDQERNPGRASQQQHQFKFNSSNQHRHRVLPPFEKCTPKSTRSIQTRQPNGNEASHSSRADSVDSCDELDNLSLEQQVRATRPLDTFNEELRESSLEEVYLCSCCGITRPLDPAMKYIPMFRNLFLLANLLVFAFGLASLGMGLWFRIDPKVYEMHKYIETQNFTLAGWIMLVAGFAACLMSLIAFMSISKHPVCLLLFYAILMTLLTISSIGSLVLLTVYGLGSSLERFFSKEIYEQMRRRTMSPEVDLLSSSDAAQFLDFVQVKLRCCGAQDFRDYQKLGMVIPTTCYTIAENYINAPGCGNALRRLFDIRAGMATGFVVGCVIVQLISVVLASLMICSIYNWRATARPTSADSYRRSPAVRANQR